MKIDLNEYVSEDAKLILKSSNQDLEEFLQWCVDKKMFGVGSSQVTRYLIEQGQKQ